MSEYLSQKYQRLTPYTPGEQPSGRSYIKLNTNESPFPPSEKAKSIAKTKLRDLNLYPDPTYAELTEALAKLYGVKPEEVLFTNGSDEILNFAFMAYCDQTHPAVFPDITYGFYPVFADLNFVPYETIPLTDDFSIAVSDYAGRNQTVFIANPNAPTGKVLSLSEIETIVRGNPENMVIVDEAYIDFGGESAVPLIHKYENLLVTQTFSKSRSMAGARLGFGIANEKRIRELNTVKYSTNPYNVNSMTVAMGLGVLAEEQTVRNNVEIIKENRAETTRRLTELGFTVLPSSANFVFAKSDRIGGKELYLELKERGILVRHFDAPRLTDYNRITIGTKEQMDALLSCITKILEETV